MSPDSDGGVEITKEEFTSKIFPAIHNVNKENHISYVKSLEEHSK